MKQKQPKRWDRIEVHWGCCGVPKVCTSMAEANMLAWGLACDGWQNVRVIASRRIDRPLRKQVRRHGR